MSETKIDATGLHNMVKVLSTRTSASMKDVVLDISAAVMTNTAQRTKTGSVKQVNKSINKLLAKSMKTSTGARIALSYSGKVRYSGKDMPRDRWILLSTDGKLSGFTHYISAKGKRVPLNKKILGEIKADFTEIRKIIKHEKAYRKARIGSSKAAALQSLWILNLRPTNTRGLEKASRAVLDPSHKQSIKARTVLTSQDDFTVVFDLKSQSMLNNKAGGVKAAQAAINGQVKAFETATRKDLEGYIKRFAERNGYTVK